MKDTEILGTYRMKMLLRNISVFLFVEKKLVEKYFDWIDLKLMKDKKQLYLKGTGELSPIGCKNKYKIQVEFAPFIAGNRFERIKIMSPDIDFNPKIHMYKSDNSLCLYYPPDYDFHHLPLFKSLAMLSEWLVKYEFFKRFGVWFGNEFKH